MYIGYKMLWIVKLLIEGKRPLGVGHVGEMQLEQHRAHVHSVANFLRVEEYRVAMIEFDANNFFRVIQRLFANKPWEFML